MQRLLCGLAGCALTLLVSAAAADAQETVKVGLIMPYSGQFADTATQMDNGIKLYMKQHGDSAGRAKIELIRKDTGGIAPDVAKRLSQEVIVRDHADLLGGFVLTPNALAAADVSAEAKKFMVVMNAATSIITTKSPYIARTSVTTPQLNHTLGAWAAKNGMKKIYTMVSDYGPGIDAETWFQKGFKDGGGEIVGSVRFPVANPDFSAVGGYDGMHLIYATLQKTGGKADGDTLIAAAKGMAWESPRGPMSIDPATRDVVQTVHINRVEKVGGELRNVEIDKVPNVKDPGHMTH